MKKKFENIAISTRIRFARNVSGINFFAKLQDENQANYIVDSVKNILMGCGNFKFYRLKNLSLVECNALFEKHLISRELIDNKDISAVFIGPKGHIFVMVNEEDHIREQCIFDGFDLYKSYFELKRIDDAILDYLNIAYSEKYGFLTSSPANLGTAMRASVMMFLPALERNGEIEIIKNDARKLGYTVRGLYGEGSRNYGCFYQISNQNSLGMTEKQILDGVFDYANTVCEMELSAREDILTRNHDKLTDEIYRAYAVLKESKLLGEEEMIKLLSLVKFGEILGYMKILNDKEFSELYVVGCSANLTEIENISGFFKEDMARSRYISRKINELVTKLT